LLAGPGATMNQMDQYLAQRLNLPATRLDPVSILALPDSNAVAEENRPSIGTVLGLGLRNL
jgi:type IV pilus assembly protein PilM